IPACASELQAPPKHSSIHASVWSSAGPADATSICAGAGGAGCFASSTTRLRSRGILVVKRAQNRGARFEKSDIFAGESADTTAARIERSDHDAALGTENRNDYFRVAHDRHTRSHRFAARSECGVKARVSRWLRAAIPDHADLLVADVVD